jgi:PHD/YefM family antitoxin component YafN of YafNO toxin-antitoxin module
MNGVQFIIDSQGQKTAVLIDLKKYGELWEDIYDNWLAQKRNNEPRETLPSVRERLKRQGKLNG